MRAITAMGIERILQSKAVNTLNWRKIILIKIKNWNGINLSTEIC
jgi:hypothetical protein